MYGYCQSDPYSSIIEQSAVKQASKILEIYYPNNELCITDSIYDLDWYFFSSLVDTDTENILRSYRIDKNFAYESPVYSPILSSLFHEDSIQCNKFVADFSAPYKGMIMCDVLPKDRRIGIYGTPVISSFLFRYNNKGEIYQFNKIEVNVD